MNPDHVHFNAADINAALVRRLLISQFPYWANLPITPAVPQGWDNRTFRLGADMSVRLPSAARYTPQVEKEHLWLPMLAQHLPLPIPVPLAMGLPAEGYPWHWSIYRWLAGEAASIDRIDNITEFAISLAYFLAALQQIDPVGPPPGPHSFFRGGPLQTYDDETRQTLDFLRKDIDATRAIAVWDAALAAVWHGSPVWFHGDIAAGNLLVEAGRLYAVIDFGCSGVGDPACDVTIAWTLFSGQSRDAFRAKLPVDDATWARGRGWALWKSLLIFAEYKHANPQRAGEARRVIEEVIAEHEHTV